MTDLVERLRAAHANSPQRIVGSNILFDEAAAELAALRERVFELEHGVEDQMEEAVYHKERRLEAEARAETAERVFTDLCDELGCKHDNEAALESVATLWRKLAEARAALKPFADEAQSSISADKSDNVLMAGISFTAGELRRAARAITGKD